MWDLVRLHIQVSLIRKHDGFMALDVAEVQKEDYIAGSYFGLYTVVSQDTSLCVTVYRYDMISIG